MVEHPLFAPHVRAIGGRGLHSVLGLDPPTVEGLFRRLVVLVKGSKPRPLT